MLNARANIKKPEAANICILALTLKTAKTKQTRVDTNIPMKK